MPGNGIEMNRGWEKKGRFKVQTVGGVKDGGCSSDIVVAYRALQQARFF